MPLNLLTRRRRVSAAPPADPAILPTGFVMHFDLSLSDYTEVDESITSIPDQSGNGYTLSETFGVSARPQTGRLHNGLEVAAFNNGAAIRGTINTTLWRTADQPYTIGMFVVLDDVSLAQFLQVFAYQNTSFVPRYEHGTDTTPDYFSAKTDAVPTTVTVAGGTPSTGEHVIIFQSTGTAASIWVDGVQVVNNVSQNVGTPTFLDRNFLGGRYTTTAPTSTLDGAIGEIVYYDTALGPADIDDLNGFLTNKWTTGDTFGTLTFYTKAGQARRHADGSQTPAANTDTEVQWNTAVFDSNDLLYTERFIVPSSWGQRWAEITTGLIYTTTNNTYELRIQRSTDGGSTWRTIVYLDQTEGARAHISTGPILVNANEQFRVQIRAVASSLIIASECPFGVFVYS